jgi:hypothetical protein
MLNILDVLVWSFWFLLGAYSAWFFFKAKDFVPLTLDELALAWKLHKQSTGCKKPRIRDLLVRKNGEVVGFTCDCGHKFLQKRLITQGVHPGMQRGKLVSISDIHSLQKKNSIMRNQNLDYKNVRRV